MEVASAAPITAAAAATESLETRGVRGVGGEGTHHRVPHHRPRGSRGCSDPAPPGGGMLSARRPSSPSASSGCQGLGVNVLCGGRGGLRCWDKHLVHIRGSLPFCSLEEGWGWWETCYDVLPARQHRENLRETGFSRCATAGNKWLAKCLLPFLPGGREGGREGGDLLLHFQINFVRGPGLFPSGEINHGARSSPPAAPSPGRGKPRAAPPAPKGTGGRGTDGRDPTGVPQLLRQRGWARVTPQPRVCGGLEPPLPPEMGGGGRAPTAARGGGGPPPSALLPAGATRGRVPGLPPSPPPAPPARPGNIVD